MTLQLGPQTAPLDALAEWSANPRTITDERLDLLKHALTADPAMLQARPLIVTPDGVVVGGNQRLRAARELGWDSIPIFVADLDETRRREWALRDNAPYGEWMADGLAALVKEHAAEGADIGLLGFSDAEAEALMALAADPEPLAGIDGGGDPDGLVDTPPVVVTQRGDLWRLGAHRVYCGDSRRYAELVVALDGGTVGCVLTDPPYGIDARTDWTDDPGLVVAGPEHRPCIGDDEPFDAAPLAEWFERVDEQFWFGADYYRRTLSDNDRDGSWLVWDKRNESSDAGFGSGFELIWSRQRHKRDVLRHYYFGAFGKEARGRMHPMQKPTPLLAEILDRWAPAGCIVADPFLGSGSTLIACERTGRACYGLEIDPAYCDVIAARWEKLTGGTAERIPASA